MSVPPPARLIDRGKFGLSVWTQVLQDKLAYGRPSHCPVRDLADHDLHMSPGMLAGGLQVIAPLFDPVGQALMDRLRGKRPWHADETRWAVSVDTEGRVGYRWYLWVFHARSVVYFVLDPARSAQVVTDELAGLNDDQEVGDFRKTIHSCDRYSTYKKFARLHPGAVLAFYLAHQRRDFLELATRHPPCKAWALEWVDAIGQLYRLNAVRLQTLRDGDACDAAQVALHEAVQCLGDRLGRAMVGTTRRHDVRCARHARTVTDQYANLAGRPPAGLCR